MKPLVVCHLSYTRVNQVQLHDDFWKSTIIGFAMFANILENHVKK